MKEERSALDDIVLFLMYANIKNALYLAQVMCTTIKSVMKEKDNTEEKKRSLKRDFNLVQSLMPKMTAAIKGHETMCKNLEIVEQELDDKVTVKHYSYAQSVCMDILANSIAFVSITDTVDEEKDDENKETIFKYLEQFGYDHDTSDAIDLLRRNAIALRNEEKFLNKMGWK